MQVHRKPMTFGYLSIGILLGIGSIIIEFACSFLPKRIIIKGFQILRKLEF